MPYKVINKFIDKNNDDTLYEVGDDFPKEGHKATKKRIEELSSKHPKYNRVFIEEVKENTETNEPSSEK
ncbi:hypothetical protein [Metabacillus halosaccharovorans]|uniref:Phage protein n=1 Tax=Metabacillus halosaccharovorans TaxID=930124 RepID=A0ABT3DGR1_9BACI|nr:hypothetical protein [Metabacillus halosaccharovorans]MCV9886244.1 hypothetical protein [Metabacillus halosaccharovorans]